MKYLLGVFLLLLIVSCSSEPIVGERAKEQQIAVCSTSHSNTYCQKKYGR